MLNWTRMHSSRMRTGRTFTVVRCLVPGGGGFSKESRNPKKISPPPKKIGGSPFNPPSAPPAEKLEPAKIGDPPNWRPPDKLETPLINWRPPGTRPPGTDLQGMLGYPPPRTDLQGMLGYPIPPLNRMTDRCKNITLPQTSFRPVTTDRYFKV